MDPVGRGAPQYHSRYSHTSCPMPGARDRHGRLKRCEEAKREFMRATGHPRGWPGHVVDDIVPLACGGADAPSNMQWQTFANAKAKDKLERRGCRRCRAPPPFKKGVLHREHGILPPWTTRRP